MKGRLQELLCGGRTIYLYTPPSFPKGGPYPVVYANDGDMDMEEFDEIFTAAERQVSQNSCREYLYAAIPPKNGDHEYSPWQAPPAFRGSAAFGGEGRAYLEWITNTLIPELEGRYPILWSERFFLGYSLGGLHALWASYITDIFCGYASLSGSLWFDGWDEFAASHSPCNKEAMLYLSLGTAEEKSRSPRLKKVGDRTRETYRQLEQTGRGPDLLTLEWNPGGHFDNVPHRFVRALSWLFRT